MTMPRALPVILAVSGWRPGAALACATCAASAFGDRTFNWAFLALMAMPFVVAGVIGAIIIHGYRRGQHG